MSAAQKLDLPMTPEAYAAFEAKAEQKHEFTRQPENGGEWLLRTFEGLDSVMRLDSLDVGIPLRDIYAKTPMAGDNESAV